MKRVLVVDDEVLFTHSLTEGLQAFDPSLEVHIANNGREGIEVLENLHVDLVVTDLQMPIMDGFELLAHMSQHFPEVPVLVMTAFGTPEIDGRLRALGLEGYIEKPVDFDGLAVRISDSLANRASGFVRGIALPTFLQIIEMERKTCTLKVSTGDREGRLYFREGVLLDAETGGLSGDSAALEVVSWPEAVIEIGSGCRRQKRRIAANVGELLLECFRVKDESAAIRTATPGANISWPENGANRAADLEVSFEKESNMGVQEKIKELSMIEGFSGAAVFTPAGENLAVLSAGNGFKAEVGVLANNVLINAQKSSLEMGTGRGQQVHIEAERAHILARCLNEGTDPLKSQPGKAHIHMVMVLTSDASIGFAKMKVNSVIEKLAEDFRM